MAATWRSGYWYSPPLPHEHNKHFMNTSLQDPQYATMDITSFYKAISAKGKKVMREKKAQGETMHLAPLGYRNVRDKDGRSVIEPDPATYELVQEAKRRHKQGMSIRKICAEMEKRGLRSKRGKVVSAMAMWRSIDQITSTTD